MAHLNKEGIATTPSALDKQWFVRKSMAQLQDWDQKKKKKYEVVQVG